METKICRICKEEKEISNFRRNHNNYRNDCKECEREYNRKYNKEHGKEVYERRKDKAKAYRELNKEKNKEYMKQYYNNKKNDEDFINKRKKYLENYKRPNESIEKHNKKIKEWKINNKEHIKNYQKNYNKEHIEEMNKYNKEWRENNIDKIRIYQKKYSEKIKNEPTLKLELQLRNMINKSFKRKGEYKSQKLELICGLNSKDLVNYLLETYKNNYGNEWDGIEKVHIDHIFPLKMAKNQQEIVKLCHYSNLQLLKAEDNLKKGSKLDWNINYNS